MIRFLVWAWTSLANVIYLLLTGTNLWKVAGAVERSRDEIDKLKTQVKLLSGQLSMTERQLEVAQRTGYRENQPDTGEIFIGPCDPTSPTPGEHNVTFVFRQAIAEGDLVCPKCGELAARRGDFSKVKQSRLGEAVKCDCCGEILVASANTEHGDDKLFGDGLPDTFDFVRIDAETALKEQWGDDVEGSVDDMHVPAASSLQELAEAEPRKVIDWNTLHENDTDTYEVTDPTVDVSDPTCPTPREGAAMDLGNTLDQA